MTEKNLGLSYTKNTALCWLLILFLRDNQNKQTNNMLSIPSLIHFLHSSLRGLKTFTITSSGLEETKARTSFSDSFWGRMCLILQCLGKKGSLWSLLYMRLMDISRSKRTSRFLMVVLEARAMPSSVHTVRFTIIWKWTNFSNFASVHHHIGSESKP